MQTNLQMKQRIFNKKTLALATLSLLIPAVIVYFAVPKETIEEIMSSFMEAVEGIFDEEGNISVFALFFNNLRASFLMMILGLIPFIYLPVILGVFNGAIIGAAIKFAGIAGGVGTLPTIVLGILPHGIFELPAMIIAIGIGISICHSIVLKIIDREHLPFFEILATGAFQYVKYVIPLLIVAAVVESYITPWLMKLAL